MGKSVEVTYKAENGDTLIRQLWLPDDDDPLVTVDADGVSNPLEGTIGEIAGGRVMFVDEKGVFGIDPSKIITIQDVETD